MSSAGSLSAELDVVVMGHLGERMDGRHVGVEIGRSDDVLETVRVRDIANLVALATEDEDGLVGVELDKVVIGGVRLDELALVQRGNLETQTKASDVSLLSEAASVGEEDERDIKALKKLNGLLGAGDGVLAFDKDTVNVKDEGRGAAALEGGHRCSLRGEIRRQTGLEMGILFPGRIWGDGQSLRLYTGQMPKAAEEIRCSGLYRDRRLGRLPDLGVWMQGETHAEEPLIVAVNAAARRTIRGVCVRGWNRMVRDRVGVLAGWCPSVRRVSRDAARLESRNIYAHREEPVVRPHNPIGPKPPGVRGHNHQPEARSEWYLHDSTPKQLRKGQCRKNKVRSPKEAYRRRVAGRVEAR